MSTDASLASQLSRLAADQARINTPAAGDLAEWPQDQALRLVAALGDIAAQTQELQAQAVQAARAGGASWASIGELLGTSRQAAQQRFGGHPAPHPDADRHLVSAPRSEEVSLLNELGSQGWRLTGTEGGALVVEHRESPSEVRRVSLFSLRLPSGNEGWEAAATRFPDAFYVRPDERIS